MTTKKRYRRSRKTALLQEMEFVAILFAILVTLGIRQGMDDPNLGLVASIFFLITILLGGSFYLWLTYKQRMKQKALRALQVAHIDAMTGEEFEEYVAVLLRFQGYKIRMTPRSGDYGVDIVATKDRVRTAIQIKRYAKKLDQKPIREAVTGMAVRQYGCTKAMVVTNSTFTKAATFLAAESGCELVDREKLGEWILLFQGETAA
ncbi:MAG TPA: restriction endonuclease [Candidatus Saccharimonadales bacterium]|nr:restriction endonuclease [Candidatus Saccharimonadales bacterium]